MADETNNQQQDKAPAKKAARPAVGDVVTYQHPDPITGGLLTGAGVVFEVTEAGGITIAPLSENLLLVDPDNVVSVDVETVTP
jgi:hypothetical protein